ncbi:MAG: signal peptidase I [Nocardioidaceae bacterium]
MAEPNYPSERGAGSTSWSGSRYSGAGDHRAEGSTTSGGEAEIAGHGSARGGRRRGRRRRRELPLWQEMILLLAIAVSLAIVLKSLFVQAFYIPSASMENTLIENDRILVEKPSYWFDDPERGDIVVFDDPSRWLGGGQARDGNLLTDTMEFIGLYPSGNHLVKRVIGVGGDRIACCDPKGRVTVNGRPLVESAYLPQGVQPSEQTFSVRVPPDRLWVMGDNRQASADSRSHLGEPGGGSIPADAVVGKVFVTVWPPGRAEFTDRPEVFDAFGPSE